MQLEIPKRRGRGELNGSERNTITTGGHQKQLEGDRRHMVKDFLLNPNADLFVPVGKGAKKCE